MREWVDDFTQWVRNVHTWPLELATNSGLQPYSSFQPFKVALLVIASCSADVHVHCSGCCGDSILHAHTCCMTKHALHVHVHVILKELLKEVRGNFPWLLPWICLCAQSWLWFCPKELKCTFNFPYLVCYIPHEMQFNNVPGVHIAFILTQRKCPWAKMYMCMSTILNQRNCPWGIATCWIICGN